MMNHARMMVFRDDLKALRDELKALPGGQALTDDTRLVLLECLDLLTEISEILDTLSEQGVLPQWVSIFIIPLFTAIVNMTRRRLKGAS